MDIAFRHIWQFKVDDVGHIVNINAACSNIGCHQYVHAPALEAAECAVTLALAAIAVDRLCAKASFLKMQLNSVCATLSAGEHDGTFQTRVTQNICQNAALGTSFNV